MSAGGKRTGAGRPTGSKDVKPRKSEGVSKPISIKLTQSEMALRAVIKEYHTDRTIYVMGLRSLVRDGLIPPDALGQALEKLR